MTRSVDLKAYSSQFPLFVAPRVLIEKTLEYIRYTETDAFNRYRKIGMGGEKE